ncbi:MAG: hypothetical protein KIT69_08230 [Propionibacteriaceae bacterium]|nr:hypothetical protein [Propionibacteriaceae bacterium]
MVAPVIKVNPESVKNYGTKAQKHFTAIRADLQAIVNATDRVAYEGDNAEKFKREAGELVRDYSKAILEALKTITDAVKTTTSNIAQSLGGQPVTIRFDGSPVVPQPVKKGDGTQSANTNQLRALSSQLTPKFASVEASLTKHLKDLQATVWEGTGKKSAVDIVTKTTTAAKKSSQDSKAAILDYIKAQLEAVESADSLRGGA